MDMTLTQIPVPVRETVKLQWQKLSHETIEVLIAELYKADCITFQEAQNLLNISSWQETAAILGKYGCTLYYDQDDFQHDMMVIESFKQISRFRRP